jgi:hypothetical protein
MKLKESKTRQYEKKNISTIIPGKKRKTNALLR